MTQLLPLFPRELPIYERALIVIGLILAAGAPFPLLRFLQGKQFGAETGDPLVQIIWMGVYAAAALPLLLLLPRALGLWRANLALVLLVLLAVISSVWSLEPMISLRRAIPVVGTFLFATYLTLRLSPLVMVRLMALALGFAAINSLLVAVAIPQYGIMEGIHDGRWRGIYEHKNVLGRHMSLGLIACLVAASATAGIGRKLFLALAALCTVLLVLAQSATAIVISLAALIGWAALEVFRRSQKFNHHMGAVLLTLLVALAATSTAFFIAAPEWLLNLLGKSSDLTQRWPLWQGAFEAISERPWFGYGYEVFFDAQKGLAWSFISQYMLWEAPHAHNGLVQLALGLGVTGIAVFSWVFARALWHSLQSATQSNSEPPSIWPLVVIITTVLVNIPEVTIMRSNNLLWIAFLYIAMRQATPRSQ